MATLARIDVILGLRDNLSSGLNKVGGSLVRAGGILTAGLTGPIVLGFNKIITSASDLNEATSATTTIYGKSAKGIIAWSKTTANAYGVANTAALDAVNVFGQVFKGVGIATDAAGKMSTQLVDSAGDLASFYNAVPSQVLADLQSGIVGQYEPLLKYGIVLNEATVNQKAMAMTGKTLESQLTNQDKIMARHTLIVEGLGDAEGDAARTANGLANVKRRLVARSQDLAAKWGQVLLPIALKFTGALLKLLDKLEDVSPRMQKMALIAATVAAALGPLLIVLGQMAIGLSVLLGPFGLVIAALTALGTAYALNLFGFRDALNEVIGAIVTFGKAIVDAFTSGDKVDDILDRVFGENSRGALVGFARSLLIVVDSLGDMARAFTQDGLSGLLSVFRGELEMIWAQLSNIGGIALRVAIDTAVSISGWLWDNRYKIWTGIKELVGWGAEKFGEAVTVLVDGGIKLAEGFLDLPWDQYAATVFNAGRLAFATINWGGIWDGVTSFASGLWEKFQTFDYNNAGFIVGQGLRNAIIAIGPTLISIAGDLLQFFYNGLQQHWPTILKWFALWPVLIPAAIVGAAVVLVPKAAEFMSGFLRGLGLDWDGKVAPWFRALPDRALDAIGNLTATLVVKGNDLIQGMWDGLVERWINVGAWLATRDDSAVSYIGDLTSTLIQKGIDLITGFYAGAIDKWTVGGVSGWLRGRGDAAISAIGDLSGVLWNTGWDLISGMADGIYAGGQKVLDAVNYIVNLIPGEVRSLLGISSPSKVMRDLLYAVPQGMAQGMLNGTSLVNRAAAHLSVAATPTATGAMSVAGVGDGGRGWGAGGVTVHGGIHITVPDAGNPDATAEAVFNRFSREVGLTTGVG